MPIRIKPKRKKTAETLLKMAVKDWLDWHKFYHFPLLQGLGAFHGLPDRIAIKKGHVYFIELKGPRSYQSDYQKTFEENIKTHNGNYLLIRDIDDLEKWLGHLK